MVRRQAALLASLLVAGCRFDPSGVGQDEDRNPAGGPGGGAADAAAFDGGGDGLVDAGLPDALLAGCAWDDAYAHHPRSGRLYRVVAEAASWTDARDACADDEATLVVIDDADENDDVLTLRGDVWIGLADREDEGRFRWVTGDPVAFTNWDSGEPNNFFNEDCVELRSGNGRWNDEDCGAARSYVCECDPSRVPTDQDE